MSSCLSATSFGDDTMTSHSELLHSTDWNVLIVLDACRYDYFLRVFGYDLSQYGIKKVDSEAPTTPLWLSKHWSGSYPEVVYISANPFINSKGVPFGGYKATDHFNCILDFWDKVDEYDRVKPELIAGVACGGITTGMTKMIVHFLQPHAPYYFQQDTQKLRQRAKKYIPMKYWNPIRRVFKRSSKKVLGLEQRYFNNYSKLEIKKAYMMNLVDTYFSVVSIIKEAKRNHLKVVITSDHAEFLGENGEWGHHTSDNDLIRTVPWVVI